MIYFITNGLNRTAGTERVILQLAQIFNEVTIIVPGSVDIAFSGGENLNIISAGIGDFPTHSKIKKIKHRVNYFFKLKKIIKSQADTIIISFAFDLNVLNILLSNKMNYKPIICEHIEYAYHSGIRNFIRKKIYKNKNVTLVCLTETDKIKFQADGIKAITIPNFIYPIKSHYLSNSKKILSIGRLEYQKNFVFLIQAFAESKVYNEGWTLDIVGEGSELEEIKSIIQLLQISNFVNIHKFTKNIGKFYKEAGLLCMTSRFEAFPMVLLEALNHALPVLITDFPTGAKEILGDQNTQIVKEYDSHVFAQALQVLCKDQVLREEFSKTNLKLIERYYPEHIIDAWRCLLENSDIKSL
ncbi:glycosyltransferase [Acinetobacter bereziniae]|uniref:glycosyltransferase n=1 Tax=Acinetobacter bereziniae TaxID=106648 RepID=UPI003AF893ED